MMFLALFKMDTQESRLMTHILRWVLEAVFQVQ